jgi:putative permease
MSGTDADDDTDVGASPSHISDPRLRYEAYRALIWALVIGALVLMVYVAQSLLVIFGALVFAATIDGGARLLGRVLPIPRGWRVMAVLLLAVAFFVWLTSYAGSQISQEAAALPTTIGQQIGRFFAWLREQGFAIGQEDVRGFAQNMVSGVGTVTRAIGGLFGAFTTLILILIIGIYLAAEPKLYERGVAWVMPEDQRGDFYETASKMAFTLRRLMAGRIVGMFFEGVFTWAMLAFGGQLIGVGAVPMAALLGIITGLFAFVPNIGAFVSGILMVLVGFSGGPEMGLYTIFVYFFVQTIDGYVVVPLIARKTVDLAPALVLAMQLIMGVLFGILGLLFADPLLAMIKVALERRAERNAEEGPEGVFEPDGA